MEAVALRPRLSRSASQSLPLPGNPANIQGCRYREEDFPHRGGGGTDCQNDGPGRGYPLAGNSSCARALL